MNNTVVIHSKILKYCTVKPEYEKYNLVLVQDSIKQDKLDIVIPSKSLKYYIVKPEYEKYILVEDSVEQDKLDAEFEQKEKEKNSYYSFNYRSTITPIPYILWKKYGNKDQQ